MKIILNGEPIELNDGATLADLIDRQGLSDAACATELNRTIVPKPDRPHKPLKDGDRVEIVTLVGGG